MATLGLSTMLWVVRWYMTAVVPISRDRVGSPGLFGALAIVIGTLLLGSSAGFAAWLVLARLVFGLDRTSVLLCARGGLPGMLDHWLINRFYPTSPSKA